MTTTQETFTVATTLSDFAQLIAGGVVQTDRGNGSAGPLYLGEMDEDDKRADWADIPAELVTEDEDPDAWRLAREALEALGIAGDVEHVAVAVGERGEGSNPYQVIYVG